ncbi:MAG TPA: hypothetical protein VGM47_08055 [Gammaproteobacteria bacterium]
MAAIITTHVPKNMAPTPGQVCPGMGIHAIDRVQPPDIHIPPIAAMDAHPAIVPAALAANNSAETPKKAGWDALAMAAMRVQPVAYMSW